MILDFVCDLRAFGRLLEHSLLPPQRPVLHQCLNKRPRLNLKVYNIVEEEQTAVAEMSEGHGSEIVARRFHYSFVGIGPRGRTR